MKIFLKEITDQEMELSFSQEDSWVAQAVTRVDERLDGAPPRPMAREISVEFSIRKVDEVVVMSGNFDTSVALFCSRCASPFKLSCTPSFSALFCKDPLMAGIAHLQVNERGEKGAPVGQNKGHARHAHDFENDDASKELDITYLSEEFIDLADVIVEQLQLQLPFQPLCMKECKGMCAHCGTDLNRGRCACSKLTRQSPFSVLEDFKVKTQ